MRTVLIKEATLDDSKDLWRWRNDEATRAMSVSTDSVAWDSHSSWFEKSLLNPNRFLYVGLLEEDQTKVGMCRYDVDVDKRVAEVSINLNPAVRGMGLSSTLLSDSMKAFFAERSMDLVATIKKKNLASIKCFVKSGFELDSEDEVYQYYVFRLQR